MIVSTDLRQRLGKAVRDRVHLRFLKGGVAPLFLLLLVLLNYWPVIVRGEVIAPADLLLRSPPWSSLAPENFYVKNPVGGDIVDYYLPILKQIKSGILDGDLPLWTPLKGQGRPLASMLDSSFFHPLTLFFIMVFPLAKGFSFLVMSKQFLSGLFMYLFLRKWDVSRAGSLLGGVGYMFSGFNVVWLMWPATLVTAFAPFLFLQTENLVRSPSPRVIALLALAVALMLLGGFPSVAGYFFYAAGLYLLVRLVQRFRQTRDIRMVLRIGAGFGLSFLLGVAVVAFQLLPSLEHADFIDISYRSSLSRVTLPFELAIQMVFPNYYGNFVFSNFQAGVKHLNETSGSVGIVTLALAFFGFGMGLLRRRGVVILFGGLALFCFSVIYGIGPFPGWLRHAPVFDLNPSTRLLSVLGFATVVCAAFGFDELRTLRPVGRLRLALLGLVGAGTVILVGMLVYLGLEILERREILSAFVDNFPRMEFHTFRLVTVAFGLLLLLVFGLVIFFHVRRPLPRSILAIAVLAVVIPDLLFFAYRQGPTVPQEYFYPETPAIRFLNENLRPFERVAAFDSSFFNPGTELYYGIGSSFSHALHSQRRRELITAFSPTAFASATSLAPKSQDTDFSSPIIDLLGIRFVIVPPNSAESAADLGLQGRYRLVYQNPGEVSIYENGQFTPAFLVPNVIWLEEPEQILQSVREGDFDPREVAFVEEPPPRWMTDLADGTGERNEDETGALVVVTDYGPETVAYRVEARRPSLLVTPELYHPGWKAFVDGEPRTIYRSDYLFRGVFVESGDHSVVFKYEPQSFRLGVIITLGAVAAIMSLLAFEAGRRYWRR